MKDDRLENLLDWYEETNPSLGDLENELDYHNIDLKLFSNKFSIVSKVCILFSCFIIILNPYLIHETSNVSKNHQGI